MKKSFAAVGIANLLCILTPMQAQAAEIDTADKPYLTVSETSGIMPYAEWLITNHSLSCSAATKAVEITSKTSASSSMAKIGFKNIVIQRSSDKVNWTDEVDVGDKLKSSASTYSLANYSVSVKGGYYYRVKLTHYAKESGLFGSSQSVDVTSNSVWVS
ncbi:MAG: hypothetical protein NC093_07245 [Alistipes sp.]|nr:hypothetical protein [Alistipes sp.]